MVSPAVDVKSATRHRLRAASTCLARLLAGRAGWVVGLAVAAVLARQAACRLAPVAARMPDGAPESGSLRQGLTAITGKPGAGDRRRAEPAQRGAACGGAGELPDEGIEARLIHLGSALSRHDRVRQPRNARANPDVRVDCTRSVALG